MTHPLTEMCMLNHSACRNKLLNLVFSTYAGGLLPPALTGRVRKPLPGRS
jgi:hypothetical protein